MNQIVSRVFWREREREEKITWLGNGRQQKGTEEGIVFFWLELRCWSSQNIGYDIDKLRLSVCHLWKGRTYSTTLREQNRRRNELLAGKNPIPERQGCNPPSINFWQRIEPRAVQRRWKMTVNNQSRCPDSKRERGKILPLELEMARAASAEMTGSRCLRTSYT